MEQHVYINSISTNNNDLNSAFVLKSSLPFMGLFL